jgi:eukaryotic-like serine/threonine-protein kinase
MVRAMQAVTGPGRVVAGRYELLDRIGQGAMGTVWRAQDLVLTREVAIKEVRLPGLMPDEDRKVLRERTMREARVSAKLNHPGVVTVYDVIEAGGTPWIVMELVAARSLEQVLAQDGPLPSRQVASIGVMLLGALASAHAAGIVHRDVKPGNVLITGDGRAVLTDFGIATLDGDPGLTQAGMVMGTPGFCAPERIRGEPASPASDLWSLGATLYAAVEGRGPFEGHGSPMAVLASIVHSDPPQVRAPGQLGTVIGSLMGKDPAQRPDAACAIRLLAEVAAGNSETVLATRPHPGGTRPATLVSAVDSTDPAGGVGTDPPASPGYGFLPSPPAHAPAGTAQFPAGTGPDFGPPGAEPSEAGIPATAAAAAPAASVAAPAASVATQTAPGGAAAPAPGRAAAMAPGGAAGIGPGGAAAPAAAAPAPAGQAAPLPSRAAAPGPFLDGLGAVPFPASMEAVPFPDGVGDVKFPVTAGPAVPPWAGASWPGSPAAGGPPGAPGQAGSPAGHPPGLPARAGSPAGSGSPPGVPGGAGPGHPVALAQAGPAVAGPEVARPAAGPAAAGPAVPSPVARPAAAGPAVPRPVARPAAAGPAVAGPGLAGRGPAGPGAAATPMGGPAPAHPGQPPPWAAAQPGQPGARSPRGTVPQPPPRSAGSRVLIFSLAGAAIVIVGLVAGVLFARAAGHGQPAGSGSGGPSPAASALPAGYHWYTQPTAAGTAAGFAMAAPDGWQHSRQGPATELRNPVTGGTITASFTPFTVSGPVREARALELAAVSRGTYPGYRRIAITPWLLRGQLAGAWRFSYRQPGTGLVEGLDVVSDLSTAAGPQPYELLVTAPVASWPASNAAFAEALRSLRAGQ